MPQFSMVFTFFILISTKMPLSILLLQDKTKTGRFALLSGKIFANTWALSNFSHEIFNVLASLCKEKLAKNRN